ncbi:MAG: tetratricopeptide repeat protein [Microcystaceae cyanobacterium]
MLDPNFVGREKAIADLHNLTKQYKLIMIYAGGGVGKTELGKKYLKNQSSGFEFIIELDMAKIDKESVAPIDGIVQGWIKQDFKQEPARDFGTNLDKLRRLLKDCRVGILIDNLEPALDKGEFIEPHRNYVELLRILGEHDGESITLITSREKLAESAIKIETYPLEGLTEEAWQDYFSYHKINIDQPTLKAMRDAYGGNAKAMDILRGAILKDNQGNMVAYWEENQGDLLVKPELKNLVTSQFNRLESHDPDAYQLLCRLGCYRYQDVPTVPTDGLLCLLWDVKARKIRVVERLKSRGLVEYKNREYWLHPVIKQEAMDRIKETEDWKTANRQAAEFGTDSVEVVNTVDDALRAFEAYYHYLALEKWEECAKFLVANKAKARGEIRGVCWLGMLRSFGFIIKSIELVRFLINKKLSSFVYSELMAYLGDLYHVNGNLKQAYDSYSESLKHNTMLTFEYYKSQKYNEIDTSGALYFILIRLGDYNQAIKNFQELEQKADNLGIEGKPYLIYIKSCLSLANHKIGNNEKSFQYLIQALHEKDFLLKSKKTWIKVYGLYNLGQMLILRKSFEEAINIFESIIKDDYEYILFKGIYHLGIGELYRSQKDYDKAIENHEESIKILEEIGAICDLAEAYYKLALTYKEMGKIDKSKVYFDKAIELFTEIDAPKQIERVQNSIQTP